MSEPKDFTPTALAKAVGISVPYACQLLKPVDDPGRKVPPTAMAIRIFRATGLRLGPIATATDEEIDVLERYQGAA